MDSVIFPTDFMIQLKKMVDHLLYRRLAAELYKDGDKLRVTLLSEGDAIFKVT